MANYVLAVTFRDTSIPADPVSMKARVEGVLWPVGDEHFGVIEEEPYQTIAGETVFHVWRDLKADTEVAGVSAEETDRDLEVCLLDLARAEIADRLDRLRKAYVDLSKIEIDRESMGNESLAYLNSTYKNWCLNLDMLAYARVKARRGEPMESGWSPRVVKEYEREAVERIAELTSAIAEASVEIAKDFDDVGVVDNRGGNRAVYLRAVQDAAAYAKAVFNL